MGDEGVEEIRMVRLPEYWREAGVRYFQQGLESRRNKVFWGGRNIAVNQIKDPEMRQALGLEDGEERVLARLPEKREVESEAAS